MELLQPRAVYRRANSDDPTSLSDDYELISVRSIQSFTSKNDQAPFLDHTPDFQLSTPPPPSLKEIPRSAAHRAVPRQLHGWKLGALGASILAGFSLLVNIVAAAWLKSHKQGSGLVEVYRGSCEVVADIDLWSHLAINVLSTLLLGGSNYCMQCLCAPTRADVDRAHQRWRFVDIGVQSVRNLKSIPTGKATLWWILALSSIPLHLMYNSAFYKSLSTNNYDMFFVQESFLDGLTLSYDRTWDLSSTVDLTTLQRNITTDFGHHYERLDLAACINAYATDFLDKRRNLVFILAPGDETIVASNFSVYDIYHYVYSLSSMVSDKTGTGEGDPYHWLCDSDSQIDQKIDIPGDPGDWVPCSRYVDRIAAVADQWTPYDHDVQYCLSEIVPQTCSYSGNIPIIVVVIICNAIKMLSSWLSLMLSSDRLEFFQDLRRLTAQQQTLLLVLPVHVLTKAAGLHVHYRLSTRPWAINYHR